MIPTVQIKTKRKTLPRQILRQTEQRTQPQIALFVYRVSVRGVSREMPLTAVAQHLPYVTLQSIAAIIRKP